MGNKFDLLATDPDVMERILKGWDPEVVIDTTMRSPSFKERIEGFKLPCKAINFNIEENRITMSLNFPMCEITMLCKNLDGVGRLREVNGKNIRSIISEKLVDDFEEERVDMIFNTADDSLEGQQVVLEEVLQHMLSIFKVEAFNFNCYQVSPRFENLFFWKYTKNFDTIKVERVDRARTILSPDQLVFLLEGLQARKRYLNTKVNGFKYEKAIPGKEIELHGLNWVTTACLMGPDVVNVATHASPSDIDINEIFLNWLKGGSPHLERMSIELYQLKTPPKSLLRDLPLTPTIFPQEEMCRRLSQVNENPRDMKCQTNGLLATINFAENFRVELLVWHKKHVLFMNPSVRNVLKSEHNRAYFS